MISIVVPTFNRPSMLRQALRSVAAQSYGDYEVLVCDDASDTETGEVVHEAGDSRVRHLRSGTNLGFMRNSIRGYLAADRPFVTTLHDDDTWEPDLLKRLLDPLVADGELAASFCDHWVMDASGTVDDAASREASVIYGRASLPPGVVADPARALLVDHSVPFILGTLVRRDAIQWDRVPEQTWRIFEMWLLYRLALSTGGLYYVPERLARYRRHDGSATARAGAEWHECFAYCWRRFADDPAFGEHRSVFVRRMSEADVTLTLQLMRERRHGEARRAGRLAVSERPSVRSASVAALAHLPAPLGRGIVGAVSSRGRT
jgi:glycosyltransferase involved in cell wall biosynthesis